MTTSNTNTSKSTTTSETKSTKDDKKAVSPIYVGKDSEGRTFYTAAGSKAAKAAEKAKKSKK